MKRNKEKHIAGSRYREYHAAHYTEDSVPLDLSLQKLSSLSDTSGSKVKWRSKVSRRLIFASIAATFLIFLLTPTARSMWQWLFGYEEQIVPQTIKKIIVDLDDFIVEDEKGIEGEETWALYGKLQGYDVTIIVFPHEMQPDSSSNIIGEDFIIDNIPISSTGEAYCRADKDGLKGIIDLSNGNAILDVNIKECDDRSLFAALLKSIKLK